MHFLKIFIKKYRKVIATHFELLFWITGLTLLFFMSNDADATSFCFFHWIGFMYCPGCGLGHSINSALHFHFSQSLRAHPLGMVSIIIILHRVKELSLAIKPKLQYDK